MAPIKILFTFTRINFLVWMLQCRVILTFCLVLPMNIKNCPQKTTTFKKFEKNLLLPWPPKTTFPVFFKFGSRSISLLFILDYTKRKLLHVNFKVVDSQEKKTFYVCLHLHLFFRQKVIELVEIIQFYFSFQTLKWLIARKDKRLKGEFAMVSREGFFAAKYSLAHTNMCLAYHKSQRNGSLRSLFIEGRLKPTFLDKYLWHKVSANA